MTLLGLAFFLSGAAALVYQVVWQRILTLHTGIGVVSVSLIVASFMARPGPRQPARRRPLRAPAAARGASRLRAHRARRRPLRCRELPPVPRRPLRDRGRTSTRRPPARRSRTSLAFLVPTTLMGMSLPFLVRATVRDTATASRVIAALYGINVLGAACGALLAPWVLVRYLGMEGAVLLGALANLLAAAAALLTARRGPARGARGRRGAGHAPRPTRSPRFGLAPRCSTGCRASWRCRSRSCGSG